MEKISLEEYRERLMNDAKVVASQEGVNPTKSFIQQVLSIELGDTKMINDPQVFYWRGKGSSNADILVYGYDVDDVDHSLSIFTGNFDDNLEISTIGKVDIQEKAIKAVRFVKECVTPSRAFKDSVENEAADLQDTILEMIKSSFGLSKIRIVYVSNAKISERIKKLPMASPVAGVDIEIQVWDIDRLYHIVIETSQDYEEIELSLLDYPEANNGLPFLEIPQAAENNFLCYLSVISGPLLAKIYREFGSQLLEGNVRSFLSTKTAVNKKIQYTINKEPSKFFVYNNGIAVTASSIELSKDQKRIEKIKNLQIINGGQTTASLAYACYKTKLDLSEISVQMKLTVVKTKDSDELSNTIQMISRSSNSQNKVSDADFFANHEFHVRMEKFSLQKMAPPALGVPYGTYWFYERAKGQYNQKKLFATASELRKLDDQFPKTQLITKTDFAKYHNSWKGLPQIVSRGASANFNKFAEEIEKAWENDRTKNSYNELYFQRVVCIAILFRNLEKNISIKKQDWFGGSYRANVITYAIAIFFKKIPENFTGFLFNFERLWTQQEPSSNLLSILLEISKKVYNAITDPSRPVENVTQWCKRDSCLATIEKVFTNYTIPLSLISPYLEKESKVKSLEDSAKKSEKMDEEIDLLSQVASADKLMQWPLLQQFINNHLAEITPSREESLALTATVKMCQGKGCNLVPTQCKYVLGLWDKAIAYGWKG
jgi:hypothetical protein